MTAMMTITEAADRLGVSRQAVHQLIQRGVIPHVVEKNGVRIKRFLVPQSAINERLAGMETPEGWGSIPTAARLRGVDETTVRGWVRDGYVQAVSTPSGRIVNLAEVESLAKRRPGPRGNRPEATDA